MSCFRFCFQSQLALKEILCIISPPNTSWHGIHHSLVIGASISLETIHLIEGSNQMDYLPVLLYFHDFILSQMI
jgi:hypothetical protein